MKFKFTWIKAKNVKNNNEKFKLDLFGLGFNYVSIFSNTSDFDLYIFLLFWALNISYRSEEMKEVLRQ